MDWAASIDSTIARVRQHGPPLQRVKRGLANYSKSGLEPPDHAIGRSRGRGNGSADRGEIARYRRDVAGTGDQRDISVGTDQHEGAVGRAIGADKMAFGVGDVVGAVSSRSSRAKAEPR